MKPSQNPVAEARDLAAKRSAIRQYQIAARRHTDAANDLMVAGEYGWAGECMKFADRLGVAALAEKLTENR